MSTSLQIRMRRCSMLRSGFQLKSQGLGKDTHAGTGSWSRARRASWWRRLRLNAATACNVLDAKENADASALTPPFVAGFDVVIDFTTPEAVVQNMRACLATGAKMVVGTTGWYDKLAECAELAERKQAGLLYGTNFSVGVQVMLQLASEDGRVAEGVRGTSFRSRRRTT